MYSEKVMDHFANPRNSGEMENPDGVGTVGNPTCGDLTGNTLASASSLGLRSEEHTSELQSRI